MCFFKKGVSVCVRVMKYCGYYGNYLCLESVWSKGLCSGEEECMLMMVFYEFKLCEVFSFKEMLKKKKKNVSFYLEEVLVLKRVLF